MSDPDRTGAGAPAEAPRGTEPPPGAGVMGVLRWVLFAALAVLAVASIASYVTWRTQGGASVAAAGALYHCPMHPTFTSRNPKDECPICGMDLEPVPVADTSGGATGAGDVPGLVGVTLGTERIQRIGVRLAAAERVPFQAELELAGVVAPDESRLRRVQLRVAGWVERLAVARTGEPVTAGSPLLELYSPELYESELEYLSSLADTTALPGMAAVVRRRLELLGVPAEELHRLDQERRASSRITLRAPVTGIVLDLGVAEGQYVTPDATLYTVADLSQVWVLADLYEMDHDQVRAGDAASFSADGWPGERNPGRIEFVYPTVSGASRTLKARLSFANPGGRLRPGMFGRVTVRGRGRTALVVPSDAVIRAGRNAYVFLARAGGRFEPREVTPGADDRGRTEILRGLAAGDTVVTSASFLIDSESRLKAALEGMGTAHEGHAGGGSAR